MKQEKERDVSKSEYFKNLYPSFYRHVVFPNLPDELHPYSYWISDCGFNILTVPMRFLKEAEESGNLEMFEVPVTTTYVADKGYELRNGFVICDVPYDSVYGVGGDDKEFWELYGDCFDVEEAIRAWSEHDGR